MKSIFLLTYSRLISRNILQVRVNCCFSIHCIKSTLAFKSPYTSFHNKLSHDSYRFLTEKQLNHQSWFLFYPEEGNKRGAPTQLLRGVEFGIETKALLFKRLCAYAGLHCDVVKGYSKSTEYLPGEEFVDTR